MFGTNITDWFSKNMSTELNPLQESFMSLGVFFFFFFFNFQSNLLYQMTAKRLEGPGHCPLEAKQTRQNN